MVPNFQHFTETSYPEPGVVPVAGVYVWSVDAVAVGGGSWETLTALVHSSDNLTVVATHPNLGPVLVPSDVDSRR